jgi:hypothetical protein
MEDESVGAYRHQQLGGIVRHPTGGRDVSLNRHEGDKAGFRRVRFLRTGRLRRAHTQGLRRPALVIFHEYHGGNSHHRVHVSAGGEGISGQLPRACGSLCHAVGPTRQMPEVWGSAPKCAKQTQFDGSETNDKCLKRNGL